MKALMGVLSVIIVVVGVVAVVYLVQQEEPRPDTLYDAPEAIEMPSEMQPDMNMPAPDEEVGVGGEE